MFSSTLRIPIGVWLTVMVLGMLTSSMLTTRTDALATDVATSTARLATGVLLLMVVSTAWMEKQQS